MLFTQQTLLLKMKRLKSSCHNGRVGKTRIGPATGKRRKSGEVGTHIARGGSTTKLSLSSKFMREISEGCRNADASGGKHGISARRNLAGVGIINEVGTTIEMTSVTRKKGGR